MHYISLLLMVLLVNLSIISAQITRTSYRVNFEVDKAELDLADKQVLDQILSDYRSTPYGELQLTAHTDADATDDYNMQLSRKRANAVTAYLTEKGLQPNRISVKWFGERKPEKSNTDDEGKSVNRRVDILLTKVAFARVGDLIKLSGPEYKQTFAIDPKKDNIIKARNGTTITIPKGSLLTQNGKPITNESVQIVMEEFLQPSDAAFQQLSTISDGRMLQSGGMFSVKAFAQDEEVVLQKGKQLQVEMPSINMQNGMELFTAVANPEGIIEWKPTSQPFNPKGYKQAPKPFTKLDTKYLNSLKIPIVEFDAGDVLMNYDLPTFPKAPKQPKLTYTYVAPDPQKIFSWYQRWFVPDFFLNKKLEAEQMRRQNLADKALSRYNKKMSTYQTAYAKYVEDSTEFESRTLETMRIWLREQKEQRLASIHYIETSQWNTALTRLITLSDSDALTHPNPKGAFLRGISYMNTRANGASLMQHKVILNRIEYLLTQSMANIVRLYPKTKVLSLDVSRYGDCQIGWDNDFAAQQMNENPKFVKLLDDAQKDILEQRQKLGFIDQEIVGTVYSTSLSSFGTFNCDKYDNSQMITVNILYSGDARISFFVPRTNSCLYANRTGTGYTARIPKGLKVKVVFVAFTPQNGPMLSIEQTSFKQSTTIQPEPKSVTLVELQKGLASL